MKKTVKRICSLLLAVCMVLTMLPATAFAGTGPATVTPGNSSEVEAALRSSTPQTIEINQEFTLNNGVTVGANHTLSVVSGSAIYLAGSCKLNIPSGIDLTVNGDGKFVCDSTSSETISVNGTLTLSGIDFEVQSAGNQVSGKLAATDCNIKIKNSSGLGLISIGEMEITGGTFEVSNTGEYTSGVVSFSSNPISISDCKVELNSKGGGSITAIQGDLSVKNSDVSVEVDGGYNSKGIDYTTLIFDNSTVEIASKGNSTGIHSWSTDSELKIINDSTMRAEHQGVGTGIFIAPMSGTASFIIDGSVLELCSGGICAVDLANGAVIQGDNYGKIIFREGSEVYGIPNKIINDRGVIVTSSNVTVGASSAAAAANAISAGEYIWDGSAFVKAIPITWSDLTANGAVSTADTTELTLTFSADPVGLSESNVNVTGATKGALTGTGNTRILAISGITVAEGEEVTVAITNPGGYAISPLSKTVPVHKGATTVTDAATPGITGQPTGATYTQDDTPAALSVTAAVSDSGTLSYQWYSNTIDSTSGGSPIGGADGESYMPSASAAGTTYYYCVVTNTNNSVSGTKTATATSSTAAVVVNAPAPAIVTGTMNIGGQTGINLSANNSGTGWNWNAATATLTLSSTYGGEPISMNCKTSDTINLSYSGNVSILSSNSSTVYCNGSLIINETGSGGTLSVTSQSSDPHYCALEVYGALTVNSATMSATCAAFSNNNIAAAVIYGRRGVTVSGGASITVNATGNDASGIWVEWGDITIDTTGTVWVNGSGTGGALALKNGRKVNVLSGTVALTGNPLYGSWSADINITGGNITIDGTPVYRALLTLSGVNADTEVTSISSPVSGYGIASKKTSADGKLCFLLPAGNQTVTLTAGGDTYTGTVEVTTGHTASGTLTLNGTDVTTYPVTVNSGTATPATAAAGATVTVTANPAPTGQQFKEWSVSPSVIFVEGPTRLIPQQLYQPVRCSYVGHFTKNNKILLTIMSYVL